MTRDINQFFTMPFSDILRNELIYKKYHQPCPILKSKIESKITQFDPIVKSLFAKKRPFWLWTWPQMTADDPGSIRFKSITLPYSTIFDYASIGSLRGYYLVSGYPIEIRVINEN